MESEGALSEIAGRAAEHKLPFLVGGGYAVIANGFKRATFDLDLIISRADKPAWIEALQTLGYTLFSENASFLQLTSNSEALMPLDFQGPVQKNVIVAVVHIIVTEGLLPVLALVSQ